MRHAGLRRFLAVAFATLAVATARGEVKIVEDEVVFSIRAPQAASVFLVGDFNNWNPTLEKMDKVDEHFEVRLFFLPGTYHYKFVIDGTWTFDPDNPPDDPSRGSLLVLEERGGLLAFGTEEQAPGEVEDVLKPSLRYVGAFSVDDGDTESDQRLDVFVSHTSRSVDAKVALKTVEDSWGVSPVRAEVLFDRGYLDLKIGEGVLKGFENDSVWTSSDPFRLLGRVGVFDYNAGFERRGVSGEMPLIMNTTFRAVYADKIGERVGPRLEIESEVFEGFTRSDAPDTSVYRYQTGFGDEDTWAIEFAGDAGSLKFGYARRGNRGFHPGILAEVERFESSYETSVYATREFWDADVAWLGWRFLSRLRAVVGLGRADGEIRTQARSSSTVEDLGDLVIGQVAEGSDFAVPLQKNRRWKGALEFEREQSRFGVECQWSEYEFETGVYAASRAIISEIGLDADHEAERWNAAGSLRYTDQDYGETPADFHLFTPERNFWLDHRDRLTVGNMVAFDLETSAQVEGSFLWNHRVLSDLARGKDSRGTAGILTAGITSRGFFEAVEYVFFRLGIEHSFSRGFFGGWDSRLARYSKPSWDLDDTFFSTYLEGGYRNAWTEVSLGFGLDPVVLDPVVNGYADIGREEYLRRAIPPGLSRGRSVVLGEGLALQERLLEDYSVVKLEVIFIF